MRGTPFARRPSILTLLLTIIALGAAAPLAAHAATDPVGGDIAGVIRDSTNSEPLANAEMAVTQANRLVANAEADQFGHFIVHNVPLGEYTLDVRMIGYRAERRTVTVTDGGRTNVTFDLVPVATQLEALTVTAQAPIAVDTRSGESGLQTERLSWRAIEHDVADPAAEHRRCRARPNGRGPHSRAARGVPVLRRRRARALGNFRQLERAL